MRDRRLDNFNKTIIGGPSCSGKTTLSPDVAKRLDFIALGCDTSMFWAVLNNKELCKRVCGKENNPKTIEEVIDFFMNNYHALASLENEIALFSETKPIVEQVNAQIIKKVAQDPTTDFASHEDMLLRKAVIYQPKKNGIAIPPKGFITEWVDAGGFAHSRRPTDHIAILHNDPKRRFEMFVARCEKQGIKDPARSIAIRDAAWKQEFSKNLAGRKIQDVFYDFTNEGIINAGNEIIEGMQEVGIDVKELSAEEQTQRDNL